MQSFIEQCRIAEPCYGISDNLVLCGALLELHQGKPGQDVLHFQSPSLGSKWQPGRECRSSVSNSSRGVPMLGLYGRPLGGVSGVREFEAGDCVGIHHQSFTQCKRPLHLLPHSRQPHLPVIRSSSNNCVLYRMDQWSTPSRRSSPRELQCDWRNERGRDARPVGVGLKIGLRSSIPDPFRPNLPRREYRHRMVPSTFQPSNHVLWPRIEWELQPPSRVRSQNSRRAIFSERTCI